MFKVICINDVPNGKPCEPWMIKFGKVYEVVDTRQANETIYYELSFQLGVCYRCDFFALISLIDEREFVRDYNTEKV